MDSGKPSSDKDDTLSGIDSERSAGVSSGDADINGAAGEADGEEYYEEEIEYIEDSDESDGEEVEDSFRGGIPPEQMRWGYPPPRFGNMTFPPPRFPPNAFGPRPPEFGAWNMPPAEEDDEVEYEYYIEVAENEELDPETETEYEDDSSGDGSDTEDFVPRDAKKGMDALKIADELGDDIKQLQDDGEEKSRELDSMDHISRIFIKILKYSVNTLIILILVFVCFVFVHFTFNKVSVRSSSSGKTGTTAVNDFKWRLLFSQANSVAKSFYEATGTLDGFMNTVDVTLRGTAEIQGEKKHFYCIKKRNGMAFLKLGAGDSARSYYMDTRGKMWFLNKGGMSGGREHISDSEGELLRSLTVFDDVLNQRAFPLDGGKDSVLDSAIKYEGRLPLSGREQECISVTDSMFRKTKFYVDPSTHFMSGVEISMGESIIKVIFDDYSTVEGNFKVPMTRTVYSGGKHYATVKLDMVVRNREIMFPQ